MGRLSGAMAWVAIGAIVAVAGYGLRGIEQHTARAAEPAASRNVVPILRVAGTGTAEDPHPIHLDAAMARTALRQGAMLVQLPDGTHFPIRIERHQTHGGGHWSVIGRVSSTLGDQAMVLTFGGNAVMGLLPLPDGRAMRIATDDDGRVTIAPAGGLRAGPIRYAMPGTQKNDYHVPTKGTSEVQDLDFAADGTMRAPDPNDRSPVRIDVLALYPPELVALRGSRAAAELEIAHMAAVADQALIDSGTRVRLHVAGFREVALPPAATNGETLEALTLGAFVDDGMAIDFERLREIAGADLVAFVRPAPAKGDGTCGASWLNGAGQRGTEGVSAEHGYLVANVAPCGPYVLAHELGHALGAAHDAAAQTDATGEVQYGAFEFSFAHRTARFGTIMADPGKGAWIGRFSNPALLDCHDARCGVEGRADNARTIDLMAPSIAAFGEPAATKTAQAPVVAAEPLR